LRSDNNGWFSGLNSNKRRKIIFLSKWNRSKSVEIIEKK
jgi:hypothetical protein